MNYCKHSTGLLLLLVIGCGVKAQIFNNVPKWQFGVGGGVFVYQGDLTEEKAGSYKTLRPAIQIFGGKLVSAGFGWRLNVALGSLEGDDAKYAEPEYRRQRAFNFNTPITEISGMMEWNILNRNYANRKLAPYIGAGVGYTFLKIERDWSRFNNEYFLANSTTAVGLNEDLQHDPPRGKFIIPLVVGVRYFISDKVGIGLETNYRRISTDYLDGFSEAANPKKGDGYYSHTLNVILRFGKVNALDCPVVKY